MPFIIIALIILIIVLFVVVSNFATKKQEINGLKNAASENNMPLLEHVKQNVPTSILEYCETIRGNSETVHFYLKTCVRQKHITRAQAMILYKEYILSEDLKRYNKKYGEEINVISAKSFLILLAIFIAVNAVNVIIALLTGFYAGTILVLIISFYVSDIAYAKLERRNLDKKAANNGLGTFEYIKDDIPLEVLEECEKYRGDVEEIEIIVKKFKRKRLVNKIQASVLIDEFILTEEQKEDMSSKIAKLQDKPNMYCHKCGTPFASTAAKFCHKCGAELIQTDEQD